MDRSLRFALITDVHFGHDTLFEGKLRKMASRADALTRQFVTAMNEVEHPEFVVNLGDVVEDETRENDIDHYTQFTQILSGLQAPVFHVAGNHDTICMTDDDVRQLWGGHVGPLYYSRDVGGLHLVFLRTHEIKDTAIRMPQEQIDWVEADLRSTELPALVFMHHPASEMRLETSRWFANMP